MSWAYKPWAGESDLDDIDIEAEEAAYEEELEEYEMTGSYRPREVPRKKTIKNQQAGGLKREREQGASSQPANNKLPRTLPLPTAGDKAAALPAGADYDGDDSDSSEDEDEEEDEEEEEDKDDDDLPGLMGKDDDDEKEGPQKEDDDEKEEEGGSSRTSG